MKERNAAIRRSVEAAGEEKRLYSNFIVKFAGLIDRHRESVMRETATVALSSGSVDKSQYCAQGSPRGNSILVLPRRCFWRLEVVVFSLVG